ncbi:MAG: hypothetical protein ACYCSF_00020 [Acidimicrobiales bacterium]
MDQGAALEHGFQEELESLLDRNPDLAKAFEELGIEDVVALGRQGARSALAPLVWGTAIGDRWDVRQASDFLGITRQGLYKRVRNGSALGVRGQGTTYFPVWQFDPRERIIRAVTGRVIEAFRSADPAVDPLVIAAWATKLNRRLEDRSPAEWVAEDRDLEVVVAAARHAARPLAA